MVVAICYAWLLENTRGRENGVLKDKVVLPVLNIRRARMWEHLQAAWLFHHLGIDASSLMFSDEINREDNCQFFEYKFQGSIWQMACKTTNFSLAYNGPVSCVYVAVDQKIGVRRGFGFVNFVHREDAEKAGHADGFMKAGHADEECSEYEICCICFDQACNIEVQDCGHQMCAHCTLALCCHNKPNPTTSFQSAPVFPFCRSSIDRLVVAKRSSNFSKARQSRILSEGCSSFKGLPSAKGSFGKIGTRGSRECANSRDLLDEL